MGLFSGIGKVFKGIGNAVGNVVEGVVDGVVGVAEGVGGFFKETFAGDGLIQGLGELGKGIGKGVWSPIAGVGEGAWNIIEGVGTGVGDILGINALLANDENGDPVTDPGTEVGTETENLTITPLDEQATPGQINAMIELQQMQMLFGDLAPYTPFLDVGGSPTLANPLNGSNNQAVANYLASLDAGAPQASGNLTAAQAEAYLQLIALTNGNPLGGAVGF